MREKRVKIVEVIDEKEREIDEIKRYCKIDKGLKCCIVFKEEDRREKTPLGVIEYREKGERGVYIDYIEIFREYRNKGYGREVIELLKEDYEIIEGKSTIKVIGFWKSVGCIYKDNICDDESIIDKYYEKGLCLPFIIYRDYKIDNSIR